MNFLQMMMGMGGVPGFNFGGGMPMGMQFLLGGGMPFGGGMPMMGGDPFAMYQMMSQFMNQGAQQGPNGGQMQAGHPAWQAQDRPTFQPRQSAPPYQQMQDLKTFANANGSRDGTPVADWTSPQEDIGAGNYLTGLMDKQGDILLHELRNATPEERAALKVEEEKLVALERQREADGKPMTGREKMAFQNEYTERLYSEGKVGDRLGRANREMMEISRYGDQTFANMFLKAGAPIPPDMPKEFIDRSPYNRNNQNNQNNQQQAA